MNILPLSGFSPVSFAPKKSNNNQNTHLYGLVMSKPINRDTVSFKATPKAMQSRKNAITMSLAKRIHEEAAEATKFMEAKLRPYLYDLEATTFAPNNPIEVISTRAKSAVSIVEKAVTRGWINREEIKRGMTDLAGMKIIMRDASRENVNKIIERLVTAVTESGAKIVEIENKRPLPIYDQYGNILKSYDYASPMALIKLQRAASKLLGREIKLTDENTPSNYMAIHTLIELPNGITGELQIMGHDVAALKELEDLCYKIKNGKNIDKKYAPIEKTLAALKDEENVLLRAEHDKYTQEAYLFQRNIEPRAHKSRKKEKFLAAPATLPKDYDFNNIYIQKQACDAAALQSAKNAEETAKAVKTVKKTETAPVSEKPKIKSGKPVRKDTAKNKKV